MRWLVVGAAGMLGQDMVRVLEERGAQVRGLDRADLDATSPAEVAAAVVDADVVVNCVAYTAVDAAESDESTAFRVNAVAPALLARASTAIGARLVQVSTDYVFAGAEDVEHEETAPMDPRSAYGRTKAAGEWAVRAEGVDPLVVRTAWLYGAGGACFPRTIARVAAERGELEVVADQTGAPTWTVDVADLVVRLVEARAAGGTYHATSSGRTTWHGFAQAVVSASGMSPDIVRPTTSDAYARPAERPAFSVLGHGALVRAGVAPIGDWRERWGRAALAVLGRP